MTRERYNHLKKMLKELPVQEKQLADLRSEVINLNSLTIETEDEVLVRLKDLLSILLLSKDKFHDANTRFITMSKGNDRKINSLKNSYEVQVKRLRSPGTTIKLERQRKNLRDAEFGGMSPDNFRNTAKGDLFRINNPTKFRNNDLKDFDLGQQIHKLRNNQYSEVEKLKKTLNEKIEWYSNELEKERIHVTKLSKDIAQIPSISQQIKQRESKMRKKEALIKKNQKTLVELQVQIAYLDGQITKNWLSIRDMIPSSELINNGFVNPLKNSE